MIPYSTVAVAPSPATTGLSLTVRAGSGARFAALPVAVLAWPAGALPLSSNSEAFQVTARVGDVLTLVRTAAVPRAIVVGDQLVAVSLAAHLYDGHPPALGSISEAFLSPDAAIPAANLAIDPMVVGEVPAGAVDGVNAVFTTAHAYAKLAVYANGVRKKVGTDYTETSGTTFTFAVAPAGGTVLQVDYGATGVIGLPGATGATGATGAAGTTFSAGAGLGLAGGVLDVNVGDGIEIVADAVAVKLDGATLARSGSGLKVAVPSGMVVLEEHIASASPTLDFTTRNKNGYTGALVQSDFDEYVVQFIDLLPATDGANGQLQVSTDGGSTWKTTGYQYAIKYQGPSGATGVVNSTTDTSLFMLNNVRNSIDGMSGELRLYDPGGAMSKLFLGDVAGLETDGNRYWFDGAWWYVSATAVNALRFKYSTGNIASGVMRVLGVRKA